jgi:4-hydroxy-2-oxoheptanedioate aldolase
MTEDLKEVVVNHLKNNLKAGKTSLMISIRSSKTIDVVLALEAAGYDCFFVDLEHGTLTLPEAGQLCTAGLLAGVTPLVRLPGHDPFTAAAALDLGSMGVIAPHLNTPAEAKRMVDACMYPPMGHRSASTTIPQLRYRSWPVDEVRAHINTQTMVIPQIETEEAVANASDIAAVNGIDMLLMGMNDLTADMGIAGQFGSDKALKGIETCIAGAKKHGKFLGVAGISGPMSLLKTVQQMGARLISTGTDTGEMLSAFRQKVKDIRSFAG